MTYWEQRAITEKLIAKRKARKPKAKGPVSGWANPYIPDYNRQWNARPLEWMDRGKPVWTGISNTYGHQQ